MAQSTKLMALKPYTGRSGASTSFYFHAPAPYDINSGDALTADTNVVGVGGVVAPLGRGLRTVSWNGMFHIAEFDLMYGGRPSFVQSPPPGFIFRDAFASLEFLQDMKNNNRVATLIIQDRALQNSGDDLNMPVILKSLTFHEEPGEPDCRYYSVSFQEYRELKIRQVPRTGPAQSSPGSRTGAKGRFIGDKNGNYTLSREMGLNDLCQAAYHAISPALRKRIITANGGQTWLGKLRKKRKARYDGAALRKGPWFIAKGVKIYIPPKTGPLRPK